MVSAAHEAVLVVDAMGEQLAVQGLGTVLEMKNVFISTFEVHIETGSSDQVAVAFGDGTRMVVVKMVRINRVPEQFVHERVISVHPITEKYVSPSRRLLDPRLEGSNGNEPVRVSKREAKGTQPPHRHAG